jgi:polar amino acid transport system substrate-binding protein
MTRRTGWLAVLAVALVVTGCESSPSEPPAVTAVNPMPVGAQEITSVPTTVDDSSCDTDVSLRPGRNPAPGTMPAGSTMAEIANRGRLRVGVDQNTYLFGFRNPVTGQLEGFDIDLAREMARDLLGDPDKIDFLSLSAAERETALKDGKVDMVVRTFSATCDRRQRVGFSATYFSTDRRVLAAKTSGIASTQDLAGKRVCVVVGTTVVPVLLGLPQPPKVTGATNYTDCLVLLQQGQVDAISTDAPILLGLAAQDPNLAVVGESLGIDNFAIGVPKDRTDLVRFVNGVLERLRSDGTWDRIYGARLGSLGPSPGPPIPRYQD